jgi:hypothetical protein
MPPACGGVGWGGVGREEGAGEKERRWGGERRRGDGEDAFYVPPSLTTPAALLAVVFA